MPTVVLYHAGAVTGAFVGVDVFFVLSEFLITGLLWRELEEIGRLSLVSFYVRRAERLLPTAAVVPVLTVLARAVTYRTTGVPEVGVELRRKPLRPVPSGAV